MRGGVQCGERFDVHAANVINATGVWADQLRPQELHDEAELPRERDLRKRLRNEQGDKAEARPRSDDYQLQMALDYLRSWSLFQRQIGKK